MGAGAIGLELAGYFGGDRSWGHRSGMQGIGLLERVPAVRFCEVRRCTNIASWRIGYESQTVDLCSKHTLLTMKNRRLWRPRW